MEPQTKSDLKTLSESKLATLPERHLGSWNQGPWRFFLESATLEILESQDPLQSKSRHPSTRLAFCRVLDITHTNQMYDLEASGDHSYEAADLPEGFYSFLEP